MLNATFKSLLDRIYWWNFHACSNPLPPRMLSEWLEQLSYHSKIEAWNKIQRKLKIFSDSLTMVTGGSYNWPVLMSAKLITLASGSPGEQASHKSFPSLGEPSRAGTLIKDTHKVWKSWATVSYLFEMSRRSDSTQWSQQGFATHQSNVSTRITSSTYTDIDSHFSPPFISPFAYFSDFSASCIHSLSLIVWNVFTPKCILNIAARSFTPGRGI